MILSVPITQIANDDGYNAIFRLMYPLSALSGTVPDFPCQFFNASPKSSSVSQSKRHELFDFPVPAGKRGLLVRYRRLIILFLMEAIHLYRKCHETIAWLQAVRILGGSPAIEFASDIGTVKTFSHSPGFSHSSPDKPAFAVSLETKYSI